MQVSPYMGKVRRAARFIHSQFSHFNLETAIILGSGLDLAIPRLDRQLAIPYDKIPGFPPATVAGHKGRLILGVSGRAKGVAVLQGRSHYYEGAPVESIALPLRALRLIGLKDLIVTAAVGSMHSSYRPGHTVIVKDHINLMGANPLRGPHCEEFGERFPDLVGAYDPALRRMALGICRRNRIRAAEGIYLAVSGPSYETPAEIRAFRSLGGDVVGMSLAPEVIVARQMGVRVLGMAWVSNMAAGMSNVPMAHSAVLSMGRQVSSRFKKILDGLLEHP